MLTILVGTDWVANRDAILSQVAQDVHERKENTILLVPELISHDMERRFAILPVILPAAMRRYFPLPAWCGVCPKASTALWKRVWTRVDGSWLWLRLFGSCTAS